jgi:hypothetical protein
LPISITAGSGGASSPAARIDGGGVHRGRGGEFFGGRRTGNHLLGFLDGTGLEAASCLATTGMAASMASWKAGGLGGIDLGLDFIAGLGGGVLEGFRVALRLKSRITASSSAKIRKVPMPHQKVVKRMIGLSRVGSM